MFRGTNYSECKEEAKKIGGVHIRHKTGISSLDDALGGGITNGLTVIGAMAGYGKSMLAIQVAVNQFRNHKNVYIYSNEMKPIDYGIRFIQLEQKIGITDECSGEEMQVLDVSNECSVDNIVEDIKNKHKNNSNMLVVLDYLQRFGIHTDCDSRKHIESCVDKLENLAYQLEIPIIVISSVNSVRNDNETMKMSSFKETNEISHAADILIAIEAKRTFFKDGTIGYELSVLKNKKGALPIESIKLLCYPQHSYFEGTTKEAEYVYEEALEYESEEWCETDYDTKNPFIL